MSENNNNYDGQVVKFDSAALDVFKERERQDKLWGEQNHPPSKWIQILGEEFGESCEALLEGSLLHYRDEMVQVAAVALAAVQCLDRGEWEPKKQRDCGKCPIADKIIPFHKKWITLASKRAWLPTKFNFYAGYSKACDDMQKKFDQVFSGKDAGCPEWPDGPEFVGEADI